MAAKKKPTIDKSKLPAFKPEGPHQDKVEERKLVLFTPAAWKPYHEAAGRVGAARLRAEEPPRARDAASLALAYKRLRDLRDAVEDALAEVNLNVSAVEQAMWTAYEEAQTDRVDVEGRPVTVYDDVSVKTTDKDKMVEWIRRNKLSRMLSVHSQTLASLTKERIVAGLEPPDGVLVGTYKRTRLG